MNITMTIPTLLFLTCSLTAAADHPLLNQVPTLR